MHLRILPSLLTTASLAVLSPAAHAQVQLPNDHVDVGIAYESGALELHWHDELNDIEYVPAAAYAFIPLSTATTRPAGAEWDFIGIGSGSTFYVAPQDGSSPDVLLLGFGAEEIVDGTFVNNTVTFTLSGISGPGAFSLYLTDGFGSPTATLSTADSLTSFDVITGSHNDFNWAFTAPGIHELTFTANGVLDDGFFTPVSDTGTYIFAVGTPIPEPSTYAAIAGLGMLGFVATRRRRSPEVRPIPTLALPPQNRV